MADHLSEEEQIEAVKRWWAANGMQTIFAVVLVIGGYFGWQYWEQEQAIQTDQASDAYLQMIEIVSGTNPGELLGEDQQAEVNTAADQLKENHSNSAYAQFAAMLKAKLAVDNQDLDTAASELQWALDNSPAPATERLVRLRLARVEAARGNIDSALQMVQGIDAAEMKSAYEEAKGDFYLLQDNGAAAFTAYESALASNESQDPMIRNILQLKISQVRPVEVAEMEEDDSEGVAE